MKNIETLQKELSKKGYDVELAKNILAVDKIRTGVFCLDWVLGGGIAQGRGGHRIEFFGPESSGKTTFALYVIKKYQSLGKTCAFIDGEKSFEANWAAMIGVDVNNLLMTFPNELEEAGDMLVDLIQSDVDLIVIDSIVSLIPKEETERDTDEPTMALQARINSLITRKIYSNLKGKSVTLLFINQLREKVGIVYGNPKTTGGGHALRHMYNTRIEFRPGKGIDEGTGDTKERIGMEINMINIKNKKGPPHRQGQLDFYFNGTIDNKKSLFFAGQKYGVIERSGNTYVFDKIKEVGAENFLTALNDKVQAKLEEEVWKRLK